MTPEEKARDYAHAKRAKHLAHEDCSIVWKLSLEPDIDVNLRAFAEVMRDNLIWIQMVLQRVI